MAIHSLGELQALYSSFSIEVRYTYHKIHQFKVYTSVVLSVFSELCKYDPCLVLEHFHQPQKKPGTHEQSLPTPASPQPLATIHLLSLCGFASSGHFTEQESCIMEPFVSGFL